MKLTTYKVFPDRVIENYTKNSSLRIKLPQSTNVAPNGMICLNCLKVEYDVFLLVTQAYSDKVKNVAEKSLRNLWLTIPDTTLKTLTGKNIEEIVLQHIK